MLLSANDLICEYELDLRSMFDDCRQTQRSMHLNKVYYKAWFGPNYGKDPSALPDADAAPAQGPELEWEDEDSFWLSVTREGENAARMNHIWEGGCKTVMTTGCIFRKEQQLGPRTSLEKKLSSASIPLRIFWVEVLKPYFCSDFSENHE